MSTSNKEYLNEFFEGLGEKGLEVLKFLENKGLEAFNYSINNRIDQEVEVALARERKREIKRATGALFEAKVKEEDIIQLLHDYWQIDVFQAKEVLRVEKTVYYPLKVIRTYLQREGYKPLYIREYIENNNVKEQLENNPTLWKLSNSPEKLMKEIKENKNP